jgi:hypothetical protein
VTRKITYRPCSWITANLELNKRWNPCGMVMDWLPSGAYRRPAIVYDDGGTETLIWYPCWPGAKPFPYPHGFGTLESIQSYGYIPTIVGELDVNRTWIRDVQLAYAGQVFCGNPQWFVTGVPRSVLSKPAAPCPGCSALVVKLGVSVSLEVGVQGLTGGAYDSSYSIDFDRLYP